MCACTPRVHRHTCVWLSIHFAYMCTRVYTHPLCTHPHMCVAITHTLCTQAHVWLPHTLHTLGTRVHTPLVYTSTRVWLHAHPVHTCTCVATYTLCIHLHTRTHTPVAINHTCVATRTSCVRLHMCISTCTPLGTLWQQGCMRTPCAHAHVNCWGCIRE